jgi:hypothetical protein
MIPFKDDVGVARVPVVTIALLLANVVVYLVATLHGGWLLVTGPHELTVIHFGAIPYEFSHWGQALRAHASHPGGGLHGAASGGR